MPKNTDTTVTEISISKDQLETIQAILGSSFLRSIKKDRILARTGLKQLLCCVCGQVSSSLYQVRYSDPEVVRLEVYCSTHIESVYQNTKDSTSEQLAAKYNCQIGEIDHTKPNPWD
jgi:hypothetical protein